MKQTLKKMAWIVFLTVPFFCLAGTASASDDIATHTDCPYCGMDRAKFAHSRFFIEYNDGSKVGTCSLHCAAIDMALKIDLTPNALMVGDYQSKKLIDAEQAFWVIGGDKAGVMTKRPKWAFEKTEDAEHFIKAHGGKLAKFDDSVQASFEDMYEDIMMIRKKRQMMKMRKVELKKGKADELVNSSPEADTAHQAQDSESS